MRSERADNDAPALWPEPFRRPLGRRLRRRRAARGSPGLGRGVPAGLAAPTPRHVRPDGGRRPRHRSHPSCDAVVESGEPAPDRHGVIDRDGRRAGAGAHAAGLGRGRHRRTAGRVAAGARSRARGQHALDARAARRPGRRRRCARAGAPAAPPSGADLDRGRRPADAAHGRRRRRWRLHPRRSSSGEHHEVDRGDPRRRGRRRTRPVHGRPGRRVPYRPRGGSRPGAHNG